MESSLMSLIGPLGGTGVSLGLMIWLVVIILRQIQSGREMDKKSLGEQVESLKDQITTLTVKVTHLELSLDRERDDRIRAEERESALRRILIENGLAEKLP